jgi:hypothetical protein
MLEAWISAMACLMAGFLKQHRDKIYIFSLIALAFPLLHRGIHTNRLPAEWEAASSAALAGAEPNIRRRAASLALHLQISDAPRIDGHDPE